MVGNPLDRGRAHVALDLPLRVLVWEAADGTVWVGYRLTRNAADKTLM